MKRISRYIKAYEIKAQVHSALTGSMAIGPVCSCLHRQSRQANSGDRVKTKSPTWVSGTQ